MTDIATQRPSDLPSNQFTPLRPLEQTAGQISDQPLNYLDLVKSQSPGGQNLDLGLSRNSSLPESFPAFQLTDSEPAQLYLAPSDYKQQFHMPGPTGQINGSTREFELHLPKGYDGKSSLPVVYMFPGLSENMEMMKQYTQMNAEADAKHFAVVYLQAEKQPFPTPIGTFQEASWNLDHGTLTPKDPTYNDLDYFKRVKSIVEGDLPADAKHQYLVGFSEGGEAAQYIAHEMPHNFSGVATVHSTRLDSDPLPRPDDPTAMISILGDDDNILPINGGHGWFSQGSLLKGYMGFLIPNVDASKPLAQAPAWARADGDWAALAINTDAAETTVYSGGAAKVEQIVRHARPWFGGGGQHAWDGGHDGWAAQPDPDYVQWQSRMVRNSDPNFDASEAIVNFLIENGKGR